jgi:hypothetical protein
MSKASPKQIFRAAAQRWQTMNHPMKWKNGFVADVDEPDCGCLCDGDTRYSVRLVTTPDLPTPL